MFGTLWVREGRLVVYRQPHAERHDSRKGPRVGIVIGYTDDGLLKIRAACGNRRFMARISEVDPDLVAREASEREATLGYPVEPVAPWHEKETQS